MCHFKRYVVFNLVMLSIGNKCQDEQYEYRIDVPKYLCDKKESLKTGVTTIRLQGKDAQKLQYEFLVNYKNITICQQSQSQRCTLTAWRAVRNLENHIKHICALQKNLQEININNTLLEPGIEYVLTVKVKNNGTDVDTKEFLLECTNSTEQNTSAMHSEQQSSHTSLILLGSNITYRDIIYFLNAEVIDCSINCSYYFKWEILDDSETIILNDSTKGSELQLSFGMLNASNQYIIRCNLMSFQKNTVIATALQNVVVVKRGIILKLAVATLVVGLKQPFQLNAYFKDADNTRGETKIEWLCKYENRKQCSGFDKSESSHQEKQYLITLESEGFIVVGRYNIILMVKKGNITKEASCEIRVEAQGFANIDVDNVDEPIDPSNPIEVPVYISNLVTNCMLQWTSINAPNYTYLDLHNIPGNINVITNITLVEDEFLNEIDEYSNGTTDIDYNLKIPLPRDNWKGLLGNTSYLFRLNVTCPVVRTDDYDDDSVEDAEPLLLQNFVTLYADVVLHTDPPPTLNVLDVSPRQGTALKTLFKFIYQANGSVTDNPMLYKFGYFLNNEIIFFSNLLGVTDTKSVLPYTDSGVKIVLEGCNSYSLCAQIFGPVIITEIPLVSEEDQSNIRKQLHELMMREEYYNVFSYSLAILETYNKTNDEVVSKSMQYYISNLTSNEIKRLLMLSADGDSRWKVPAGNLIKNIGILLNKFSASAILLNNVVTLRNELARKNSLKLIINRENVRLASRKLLTINELNRFKREVERMTLEEVKSYLVISELIITSSPDKRRVRQERENLLTQIDKFMRGLCSTLFDKSQIMNLELRTMILSVEKINKNAINRYMHILYSDNSWNINGRIKLGKCFMDKLNINDRLCLGKAVLKNYFGKKGITYMLKIYSVDSDEQPFFGDIACESMLVLPIDEKQIQDKEAKCALLKRRRAQSECKTLQVTKNIQCSCNSLGYYAVEYVMPASSTTLSSTMTSTTLAPVKLITTTVATTVISTITTTDKNALYEESTTPTDMTTYTSLISTTEPVSELSIINTTSNLIAVTFKSTDFPDYSSQSKDMTTLEVLATDDNSSDVNNTANNTLVATLHVFEDEDAVVYYCIIGFSIAGILMLVYGIKQLLSKENEDRFSSDFPKYALIHHPEVLQDIPNKT